MTEVCGSGNINCYKKANTMFYMKNSLDECKCLPRCSQLVYHGYETTANYEFVTAYSINKHRNNIKIEK